MIHRKALIVFLIITIVGCSERTRISNPDKFIICKLLEDNKTVLCPNLNAGQGPKGDKGDTGIQGEIGITGSQGLRGNIGPTGTKGDTGSQGPKGDKGSTGIQGVAGGQGIQGLVGTAGNTGAAGSTGASGLSLLSNSRVATVTECTSGGRASDIYQDTDASGTINSGDSLLNSIYACNSSGPSITKTSLATQNQCKVIATGYSAKRTRNDTAKVYSDEICSTLIDNKVKPNSNEIVILSSNIITILDKFGIDMTITVIDWN